MKQKLKIVIDILFRNKTYVEYKNPEYLSILGRVIVTDNNFKSDEEYFKEALIEAIQNESVLPFVDKSVINDFNGNDFKIGYRTKAYTVELKLVK